MKIGRLIERNVFIFLWLFFFTSTLLISFWVGGSFDEDAKFIYWWYANKYICWPHVFLFNDEVGAYFLGPVWDAIIIYAISLVSFIAADFLWRKIFWNEKKNIDTVLIENLSKTPKTKVLQIITVIVKWTGRLLACLLIPFLMNHFDFSRWLYYEANLHGLKQKLFESQLKMAGDSVAILGCIIGWRFPLIGAIMMLVGDIPFHINEGKISLGSFFSFFYLLAVLFFATWALRKFSERILKKNAG